MLRCLANKAKKAISPPKKLCPGLSGFYLMNLWMRNTEQQSRQCFLNDDFVKAWYLGLKFQTKRSFSVENVKYKLTKFPFLLSELQVGKEPCRALEPGGGHPVPCPSYSSRKFLPSSPQIFQLKPPSTPVFQIHGADFLLSLLSLFLLKFALTEVENVLTDDANQVQSCTVVW